ncbi:MAG: hypothetical protein V4719_22245 [Planctomycetota bacterium]
MTVDEVKALAEALLKAEDNGIWKYDLGTPERDRKRPREWNVSVRWVHPSGTPVDGPGIIIVDEGTREARFF